MNQPMREKVIYLLFAVALLTCLYFLYKEGVELYKFNNGPCEDFSNYSRWQLPVRCEDFDYD